MSAWTWASATAVGTSHLRAGTRRQDAYRCHVPAASPDFLVCVVSDGAGTAEFGGQGASLICRKFSAMAEQHLRTRREPPSDTEVLLWLDSIRDSISFAAHRRSKIPRDFAATMIAIVSSGDETLIVQVGDGCAVIRDSHSGEWRAPIWPDHGEYASTTSFVTDSPSVKCRFARVEASVSAVVALTDGLERLALDFSCQKPFEGFFDGVTKPVDRSAAVGRDMHLSTVLREYLLGDAICSRTDDDKTLVVATRR